MHTKTLKKWFRTSLLTACGTLTVTTTLANQQQVSAQDIANAVKPAVQSAVTEAMTSHEVTSALGSAVGGNIDKTLKNLYLAKVKYNNTMDFQADDEIPGYAQRNALLAAAQSQSTKSTSQRTLKEVNMLMRQPMTKAVPADANSDPFSTQRLTKSLGSVPGTDSFINFSLSNFTGGSSTLAKVTLSANPFNPSSAPLSAKFNNTTTNSYNDMVSFANLIDPLNYGDTSTGATANSQLGATLFVMYASKLYSDIFALPAAGGGTTNPLKDYLSKHKDGPDDKYYNFLSDFRAYVAKNSVGISNLNHLVTERSPLNAGDNNNMSPLQLQHKIATYRTSSPSWYQKMATASPATIQRETLFVLAEIEAALYQTHIDSERMLAAVSVMELATTTADKQAITQDMSAMSSSKNNAIPPTDTPADKTHHSG